MNIMLNLDWIIPLLVTGIFTVLWFLIRGKFKDQDDTNKTLFIKHDNDVKELQELRLMIAARHYEKSELDIKFDKLERTMADGFNSIGNKFDHLSDVLIKHISLEHNPPNGNNGHNGQ